MWLPLLLKKSIKHSTVSGRRGRGSVTITAAAIRERGTANFIKVIRFGCSLPQPLQESLNSWIAIPHRRSRTPWSLFLRRNSQGRLVHPDVTSLDSRSEMESWILSKCSVLTLCQMFASFNLTKIMDCNNI